MGSTFYYIEGVGEEFIVEEDIGEKDVECNDNKSHEVHTDVVSPVKFMTDLKCLFFEKQTLMKKKSHFRDGEIIDNFLLLLHPLLLVNDRVVEVLLEVFDGTTLHISPDNPKNDNDKNNDDKDNCNNNGPWYVEGARLKEEKEIDPLIVGVIHNFSLGGPGQWIYS